MKMNASQRIVVGLATCLMITATSVRADDWPEWRGKGRLGVWNDAGILDTFPADGLKVRWRAPIGPGFAGPVIAGGRVFVPDFKPTRGMVGLERVVAFDEETGQVLWEQAWEADYRGVGWFHGSTASPTVDGDRVYIQGTAGALLCLDVETGRIIWQKHYGTDFAIDPQQWPWFYGFTSAPLVDGPRLITVIGIKPSEMLVAFDKLTGEEIWRGPSDTTAITADWGPGTGWPMIINAAGRRQLIFWHPLAVVSLDPTTGETYWEEAHTVYGDVTVAGPVQNGSQLLVTSPYNGPLMFRLDEDKPGANLVWKGTSDSELTTDKLHGWISVPVIYDGYIYGVGSYGQFRCLNATTGERVWESQEVLAGERVRWAQGFVVRHGDRAFVNTDRGELVMVRLSPDGYQELSRTQLIKPTSPPHNRRELRSVNWVHAAYANQHVCIRNDEEILCASLAAEQGND